MKTLILLLFLAAFTTACVSEDDRRWAAQLQQLEEARASRHEAFESLLAEIRKLPHEQQMAAYDRLERQVEDEARQNREQDMSDAQRELAGAINDLSSKLDEKRY